MKNFVLIMLAVSLVIAGFVSHFASEHPDGLEKVAEDQGFIGAEEESALSVMPDYTVPGARGFLSNGLAGVIGVLASFVVVILVGKSINYIKR